MTKSVADHVADMLADIQQQPGPLDESNNHTPTPDISAEKSTPGAEDTEPIHVFFVRESEVQQALLDARSVEAEPEAPTTPQPVTSRKAVTRKTVLSVGIFTICLLISILLVIIPQFVTPQATVTIIPVAKTISATKAITVHARVLPALTLSQSQTVPATGKRHQDAAQAHGTITFYNGLFTIQTVGAGTIFTASNGVPIVTDQPAIIPAGNPPSYGQVTVLAHAIVAGSQGNIQAYDINQACCATSVLAKNTQDFTGGQNAREYLVVTKADIDQPATILAATLEKSERAALEAQLKPGEALITPPCTEQITTNHKAGEEASSITVSVSETCSSVAYPASDLHRQAIQMLDQEAIRHLGTGYIPFGDTHVTIIHATISDQARGIATL
jgi:hypothetical protein